MEKIRVMIVDDHAILRMGLASLLNAKKDIEVVGEANSGAAALRNAPKLKPDVIVMDLIMPEMDGVETTRRLKELMPEARILILTTFGTADGIEKRLIESVEGVTYHSVKSGKLRRYFDMKNFSDPFRVIAGCFQSAALVRRIKPDIVFSKGGFVSVPVVYGAKLSGVPVLAFGIPAVLSVYFDLFSGFVQAYVFTLLTMVYIANSCPPPEEAAAEE